MGSPLECLALPSWIEARLFRWPLTAGPWHRSALVAWFWALGWCEKPARSIHQDYNGRRRVRQQKGRAIHKIIVV